jgi:hypothetical protein
MTKRKKTNKKQENKCTAIEPFFDVVIVTRTESKTSETFKVAKDLENLGLEPIAVYDSVCTIYGRCTQTTMGVLMANASVKSIEKNGYE